MRTLHAELVKMWRRRVLVTAAITSVVFAVGGAFVVMTSAEPTQPRLDRARLTLEGLADAGGGTDVFSTAVSFAGTFLFVVFVGAFAVEYSRGTFRTMLLRQPGRVRIIGLLLPRRRDNAIPRWAGGRAAPPARCRAR